MIQANGGNDTIDVTGSIIESTVYGGQGTDYISGVDAATSISASVIGQPGADQLSSPLTASSTLRSTDLIHRVLTLVQTRSLLTLKPSKLIVYGGAGGDTLLLLATSLAANS